MEALNKKQESLHTDTVMKNDTSSTSSNVSHAANDLLNESKKLASEIYEESLHKLSDVEQQLKVYTDHVMSKIKDRPLTSLLIAGGVGFVLSKFLRK